MQKRESKTYLRHKADSLGGHNHFRQFLSFLTSAQKGEVECHTLSVNFHQKQIIFIWITLHLGYLKKKMSDHFLIW